MNHRHTLGSLFVVWLSVGSVAATVFAQGGESGRIEGTVTDRSGAVVAGATIIVKNKATGFERTVQSEQGGFYRIPALQPGAYLLTAELSGFAKVVVEEVVVNVGRGTDVNVRLEPAGLEDVITVSAVSPLIETTKTDVGGVVDTRQVNNMPVNGRTFSGLAMMIPGTRPVGAWDPTKTRIGAVSIAGAGGRNINTTIDGIDNKDNTVGGYVQNISIEAVQEFALKTQRFSAADGRSQGGLLSIVTKSGSNKFHGSFFSFFRDDKLNSNDYFSRKSDQEKPEFSREQFGGSIGGPVARDRMFFFFAAERLQEDQSIIAPPNSFRELSVLKGAGISIYGATPEPSPTIPTPFRNNLTNARIDFSFNEKNTAYLSWSENRDTTLNDQAPEDLTTVNFNRNKNELFSFVWNSILSPTKLNHFVAGYSYWHNLIDTDKLSPVTVQFANVSYGTNVNVPQESYQAKWQIKDAFNWTAGNHGLKFGFDYVFQPKLGGFFKFDPVPVISFFDNPSVILNDAARYPQGLATPGIVQGILATNGDPVFDVRDNIHMFGGYIQDDWKAARKLTFNLGVRYDVDINLLGANGQERNRTYLILKQINSPITNPWVADIAGNDRNNISPRVGVAYDLAGNGKSVARGGYGIYFDQVFLNIPLFAIQQANPTIFGVVYNLQNTTIGRGDLPNFRVGIDPIPPIPGGLADLPNGATGRIVDPTYKSPMAQHWNIGFSREFWTDFVFEADYTHVLNLHEPRRFRLNPRRVNPQGANPRVLEDAFAASGLPRNRLADVVGEASVNRSRYDGLTLQVRKRFTRGIS